MRLKTSTDIIAHLLYLTWHTRNIEIEAEKTDDKKLVQIRFYTEDRGIEGLYIDDQSFLECFGRRWNSIAEELITPVVLKVLSSSLQSLWTTTSDPTLRIYNLNETERCIKYIDYFEYLRNLKCDKSVEIELLKRNHKISLPHAELKHTMELH